MNVSLSLAATPTIYNARPLIFASLSGANEARFSAGRTIPYKASKTRLIDSLRAL